jgi:hypothetical protein
MIASARPLPHPTARWHLEALRISSELTCTFRRMKQRNEAMITPQGVIDVLVKAGVKCVLMGTYGITGWRSEPRATQDVDVLVTKRDIRKAVRALREAFPDLSVSDTPVVTRFVDPAAGLPVIDVMKPTQPIYQIAMRYTLPIGNTHRIPDLEMALISKFAAMVSPNRRSDKKLIDAGDFINIVQHNRENINVPKLKRLADKVYSNGGAEMVRLIADIDAGRTIQV